jgi:hypothetical protein
LFSKAPNLINLEVALSWAIATEKFPSIDFLVKKGARVADGIDYAKRHGKIM